MGTKNNPGEFDCYENAEPDEPMFVLLGRDPQAPALVADWAMERQLKWAMEHAFDGTTDPKVPEAQACAASMIKWRQENRPA